MKTPVYVIGTGGLGRELAASLRRSDDLMPAGFYDDRTPAGTFVLNLPVLGTVDTLMEAAESTAVLFGIANAQTKEQLWHRLSTNAHLWFPTFIDPAAVLLSAEHCSIRPGTVVLAGAVIGPDVQLGRHCLLHFGTLVSHDTRAGDFCTLLQRAMIPSGGSLPDKTQLMPGEIWRPLSS